MQITKFSYKNSQYPDVLRNIAHPPKQLFCLGNLPGDRPLVAVVGSRRATEYGRQVTYKLAYDLAQAGIGVVSGLALGIDASAHRGALDAGGYTLAVMAHGLDEIYPSSNRGLAKSILAKGGCLISEYDAGTPSLKQHFVARNRIVSGLSQATIVTEADAESGSLITANFALEQDRAVMAVPGNITSLRSAGPNNLLKKGAIPVTSAVDVLEAFNWNSVNLQRPAIIPKSADEAKILELLDSGVSDSQSLIEQSQLDAAKFATVISLMEITGKVRNLGAGTWVKS